MRAIDRAREQPFHRQKAMLGAEECNLEVLPVLIAQTEPEELATCWYVSHRLTRLAGAPRQDAQRPCNSPIIRATGMNLTGLIAA
ncbi:hypothetical protein WAC51_01250 [Stenotrophomonas geniculata]|jgi:hypothetical protein|uniref:hypothetical protein n=1 Tax=Stenotrophomonas geniculata TaxID=86188 RepID=UPI0030CB8B17